MKLLAFKCIVRDRPRRCAILLCDVENGFQDITQAEERVLMGKQSYGVGVKNCITAIRVFLLIDRRARISLRPPLTIILERTFVSEVRAAIFVRLHIYRAASVAGVNVGLCAVIALHLSTSPWDVGSRNLRPSARTRLFSMIILAVPERWDHANPGGGNSFSHLNRTPLANAFKKYQ